MASRFLDLERKSLLVQFIAVTPLTFYSTADGTDLVQDILHSRLSRPDSEIFGQEGSITVDDHAQFLKFEPADANNRTLHLPIEHLAYCGALRRMRRDPHDQRNPEQIYQREYENVDLANRFAHLIIGPPVFVAVFHGFDNALCYSFVTQSADDACLLVMKVMRAFKMHELQLEQQGRAPTQGYPSLPSFHASGASPSPDIIRHGSPFIQPISSTSPSFLPGYNPTVDSYPHDFRQDDLIHRLLSNPNLQLVSPANPFSSHRVDDLPILSASTSMVTVLVDDTYDPRSSSETPLPKGQENHSSSIYPNSHTLLPSRSAPMIGRPPSPHMRPPSPPVFGLNDRGSLANMPLNTGEPQVIYKPSNQEVVYKQNIMVRWLQPPTPPPPAPIIIREVQAPAEPQAPIICRQVPRSPPTPPPIIVREKPPPCPPTGQPLIIEKRMPPVSLPRQVIVERYPAPATKPPPIIYEKYLPAAPQPRQVIVRREVCQPTGYPVLQNQAQQFPGRQIIREVIRQVPQTSMMAPQPALVCVPQQQQVAQVQPGNAVQQLVPVYATRQHVVQPQGVRVIRQVIGPPQGGLPSAQPVYASNAPQFMQTVQPTLMQ